MTYQDPQVIFRKKMENENTPYLQRILEIHNTHEWSEEKFEIIADILRSRVESIPDPLPPQLISLESPPQTEAWLPNLLMVTCLVLVIMALYYKGMYQAAQARYQNLAREGRTVSATVTGLNSQVPLSEYDFTTYAAQYSFQAFVNGEQKTICRWQNIPDAAYNSLKVGQTIEVAYDVSNPSNFAVNPEKWSSTIGNFNITLILGFGIGVLTYLAYIFYRNRRAKTG